MLLTMGSQNAAAASTANVASARSILTSMDTFVKAVNDMDETILIPSRLIDMSTPRTIVESKAIMPISAVPGSDLFSYYQMLNAIKHELVAGPALVPVAEKDKDKSDEAEDDHAAKVAIAFRHHLQGLFGVLKQLTGTAKYLTERYQEEIGDLISDPPANSQQSFLL